MIRKIIYALALLFVVKLGAQEAKFGAKAGFNFSSLAGNVEGLEGKTGFHLGMVAEFASTGDFSVQPELLYSSVGAKAPENKSTLNFQYISFPVMAKYYIVDGLSLEAGPQISFNIAAEREAHGESQNIDDIEVFELAAGFGAGYLFTGGLFFQARYVFGIHQALDFPGLKNRVFQLSTGYKF